MVFNFTDNPDLQNNLSQKDLFGNKTMYGRRLQSLIILIYKRTCHKKTYLETRLWSSNSVTDNPDLNTNQKTTVTDNPNLNTNQKTRVNDNQS